MAEATVETEVLSDGKTIEERLQMLLDHLNITPLDLNEACGFKEDGFPACGEKGPGRPCYIDMVLRGQAELTPARAERIRSQVPVNMSWLMHGVGKMLFRRNPNERNLWDCAAEKRQMMYEALSDLHRWDLEYLYEQVPPPEEEGRHATVHQGG